MIKDWSVPEILTEISKIAYAEKDAKMTGFVTWGCKQDLYQILWYCEQKLRECSTYANEDEYVKNHEKKVMWQTLKGKQNG